MITAIREGGITWLLPQVGHLAHAEEGPLITWVGAISIWIFGPFIGDITAGRLPNLLWFGITASSVWYGTYLLGRRSEAQPLALPFGGEPPPRDYGRMLADAALLLLLATVGILQRTHETTVIPAIMACQALAFYSLARSIDRPLTGATTLAIALAASFLTRGWIGAIPIMAGALLTFYPRSQLWRRKRWLPWIVLLTAALILAWWIPPRRAANTGSATGRSGTCPPSPAPTCPTWAARCATCPGICGPPGRSPCWLSGAGARGSTRRISGCR